MRLSAIATVILISAFVNVSFAQIQGCKVGNLVYTHYYGYSNQNAFRYYDDDVEVASECGWTRSGSGQFTCYVYDGRGDMSEARNYEGPYEGGTFTMINNCDLDDYLWLFILPMAISVALFIKTGPLVCISKS